MHPRLLTTPFFTVYTFGLLLASAYLAAFWWLMREGRRQGLDVDALASLGFWAIGGAFIGAKALMILRDLPEYVVAPWNIFALSVLSSAGDFYGGFVGALIASAIFFWRDDRLPFWRAAERVRSSHRAGPSHRPHWLLHGWRRLRATDSGALGRDLH
jgi:phosphatidylglycerol---prolipoprotein diacylglyceryl transferase